MRGKKNIAIIDMSVRKTSPAGSCVLAEIEGLVDHHSVHVFTSEIEDTLRDRVVYHKVPLPKVPNFLRYFLFYHNVKSKINNTIKLEKNFVYQTTQGQYAQANIAYPHFCHKAYLNLHWKNVKVTGLRKVARYLSHKLNVWMEEKSFRNAAVIVVPSKGLAGEIIRFYPHTEKKIKNIPNPVDIGYFARNEVVRNEYRQKLNYSKDDLVISFSALGDFERKGLGLLLESVAILKKAGISYKLLIVGGKSSEIDLFRSKAKRLGIAASTNFVGFHSDIRPFLWSADIFSLPSIYEVFPLVAVQAAASGLPLLVTRLNGVEEYLVDSSNGWFVERSITSIVEKLTSMYTQKEIISSFGKNAVASVAKYDFPFFHKRWRDIYDEMSI